MTGGNCVLCVHLRASRPGEPPTCEAFPEGVPVEIYTGDVTHEEPYEGDNGVRFELDPDLA